MPTSRFVDNEGRPLRVVVASAALIHKLVDNYFGIRDRDQERRPPRQSGIRGEPIVQLRLGPDPDDSVDLGWIGVSPPAPMPREVEGGEPPRPPEEDEDNPPPCPAGSACWDSDNGFSGNGVSLLLIPIVVLIVAAIELFRGAVRVNWSNFPNNMGGGGAFGPENDFIQVTESQGSPGMLTVTMELGPGINWWKAAELYNKSGTLLGSAWVKRDEGVVTNTTFALTNEVDFLVLKKAKAFGVHTSMYVIYAPDLAPKDGRHITFRWIQD
jgi:hypothetical protein